MEFKEKPARSGEEPVLTLTERNGFVRQADRFHKRLATEDTSNYKLVRRHDIAFNPYLLWAGAVAQNTIVDAGVISPLYPTFRVRDGHDPRFVARLLLTPQLISAYDGIAFGSVPRRRRSSVRDFLNLPLPSIPNHDEQRRIAAILDQADALRTKRRESLALLDTLAQSTFHDMFGDMAPSATVDEIAAETKGSIRTGPFGSQLLHSEFVDEGIAVLGLDNVVGNEFNWSHQRFITPSKYEELRRYTVSPGDVLISIMGTVGRCVVVPDDIPTAINTKHICAITVNDKQVLPEFVRACFLWHSGSRAHLRRQTKGSIMDGLNMGIIKAMPIPVPSFPLQRDFTHRAQMISANRIGLVRASQKANDLFTSLQARAFSGAL
ncbi:restriction endonuclease subunit S [Georgenia alba]|uniref:Restriction endonuclease subunit S n=1 Tax=Georgenia alba TaxID=2233858 RepID=A0ABW2QDT4_9MICO